MSVFPDIPIALCRVIVCRYKSIYPKVTRSLLYVFFKIKKKLLMQSITNQIFTNTLILILTFSL